MLMKMNDVKITVFEYRQHTFIKFNVIIASAGCVKYIAVNTYFNLRSMLILILIIFILITAGVV